MEIKEEQNRFALYNDDNEEIGEITWTVGEGDSMVIDHTFVNSTYRGQKLANQLMAKCIEKARNDQIKIVPVCSFAVKEFDRNPDYQDVLLTD